MKIVVFLFLYLLIFAILMSLSRINHKKILVLLRNISDINDLRNIYLTDADIMPILGVDDPKHIKKSNMHNIAIALNNAIIIGKLLAGVNTTIIASFCWGLFASKISSVATNIFFWGAIALFFIAIACLHLISKWIFVADLYLERYLNVSDGHSVAGKSFFYFNPLFGYRYFYFSKQLDEKFGLFENKK